MSATMKILTGAAGLVAAGGLATPASAQYYPEPGYPQPGYGYGSQNPVGQVLGQILGYGQYPYGNYGYNQYRGGNQSMAVDQCARAVESRIGGYQNGYYGYGNVPYGGQYGYNGYARPGGRVLGV